MANTKSKRKSPTQIVAENCVNIINEQLEKGVIPWSKSCTGTVHLPGPPSSVNGHIYTNAANAAVLFIKQMTNDSYGGKWISANQLKKMKGRIKEGEAGTTILCHFKKYKDPKTGKLKNYPFDEAEAIMKGIDKLPVKWVTLYSKVFNVSAQTEGLAAKYYPEPVMYDPGDLKVQNKLQKKIDKIIKNNGVHVIDQEGQNKVFTPCFIPGTNIVGMPKPEFFKNGFPGYVNTFLHESTHFSGDEDRLGFFPNKGLNDGWSGMGGGKASLHRAVEELTAELGSATYSAILGVPSVGHADRHAAYIKSWQRVLGDDPTILFDVAKDAALRTDFLNNNKPEYKYLYDACETSFEKHVASLCIAKSKKDPDFFLESLADKPKADKIYTTKTHIAGLAVTFPEQLNVSPNADYTLDRDYDDMKNITESYQRSISQAAKALVERMDMDFDNEPDFDPTPAPSPSPSPGM